MLKRYIIYTLILLCTSATQAAGNDTAVLPDSLLTEDKESV